MTGLDLPDGEVLGRLLRFARSRPDAVYEDLPVLVRSGDSWSPGICVEASADRLVVVVKPDLVVVTLHRLLDGSWCDQRPVLEVEGWLTGSGARVWDVVPDVRTVAARTMLRVMLGGAEDEASLALIKPAVVERLVHVNQPTEEREREIWDEGYDQGQMDERREWERRDQDEHLAARTILERIWRLEIARRVPPGITDYLAARFLHNRGPEMPPDFVPEDPDPYAIPMASCGGGETEP